jgi:hypothetical protein
LKISAETLREEILLAKTDGRILPLESPIGIMVLSGPPAMRGRRIITEWSEENIDRIYSAAALDFIMGSKNPWIMLNGLRNQLPMMLTTALESGIPASRIICVDCGARPHGNTKSQFTVLNTEPRILNSQGNVVVITSWYHMARVARTIPKNAPANENLRYWVYSPQPPNNFVVSDKTIEGEIERILKYIEAGDLVEIPEPYLPKLQFA